MARTIEILFYRIASMISTRLLIWVEQFGEPKIVELEEPEQLSELVQVSDDELVEVTELEPGELVEPSAQQAPSKAPVVHEPLLERPRAKATKLVIDRKPVCSMPELELAVDNGECVRGALRERIHYELPDGWEIINGKLAS